MLNDRIKNKPMVSVLMSAYNVEEYVSSAIDSIKHQDYAGDVELIICDDCSTDSTVSILEGYDYGNLTVTILKNESNSGAAFTRNRCIAAAQGDYLMIQDADDLARSDRISLLVEALENAEDASFVGSGYYLFDDNGPYKDIAPKCVEPEKKDFLFALPFCHASTMFKAECMRSVGGYRVSKETRRGQDYDMFMRMYAAGWHGINIPACLYGYRVDSNTMSRRKFEYRLDECVIRWKGFKAMGLLPGGLPYVLKPIAAHFVQQFRRR